jgi:hemerythrin superfamily protein
LATSRPIQTNPLVRDLLYETGKEVKMNALELLKQDHATVKDLFEQAEGADDGQLEEICRRIQHELETHAHIEETIFYPAMEKHEELREMVRESLREHQQIKRQLQEMAALGCDSEDIESKLEDLMETVEHHAEDEEEGKMFPEIIAIVDSRELEQIGQRLAEAKGQNQPQRKVS